MVIGVYVLQTLQQKIYYSSYGDFISIEVKQYMMEADDKLILSSNVQIQDFN